MSYASTPEDEVYYFCDHCNNKFNRKVIVFLERKNELDKLYWFCSEECKIQFSNTD